jgi:hypothetical protein
VLSRCSFHSSLTTKELQVDQQSTMASSSSEPELKSEQEVIAVFQDMRKQISGLFNNLHALEAGQ